jgi:hypothetical protein
MGFPFLWMGRWVTNWSSIRPLKLLATISNTPTGQACPPTLDCWKTSASYFRSERIVDEPDRKRPRQPYLCPPPELDDCPNQHRRLAETEIRTGRFAGWLPSLTEHVNDERAFTWRRRFALSGPILVTLNARVDFVGNACTGRIAISDCTWYPPTLPITLPSAFVLSSSPLWKSQFISPALLSESALYLVLYVHFILAFLPRCHVLCEALVPLP